ncbi:MAG: excinuclease ABC subunit UvrC [Oscillospiraceae bacterium]|nr:excinuclease ABC subunit UvrC [Oscillospiraceae bacterium]
MTSAEAFQDIPEKFKLEVEKAPAKPGVYLMKDSSGKIIYIGKAKVLRARLRQYLRISDSLKTQKMMSMVNSFDFIITDSEYEALVLECNLIKIYSPKYNILLKDSKGYHYIKITYDGWPRMDFVSKKDDDSAKYLGPYTNFNIREIFYKICSIFRISVCNRKKFESDSKIYQRPCLNFYINKCSAPCSGAITKEDYEKNFENALDFLKNGNFKLIKKLRSEMIAFANILEFEKAAKIRDNIRALSRLEEKQNIVCSSVAEQDVISFVQNFKKVQVEIFKFHIGNLYTTESFFLDSDEDLLHLRSEFIKSYYFTQKDAPEQITLDGELNDKALIKKWLFIRFGKKIKISVPKIGKQSRLVGLCSQNAKYFLDNNIKDYPKLSLLEKLSNFLNINGKLNYIESYDISNTHGSENVGAMVVFKDGVPLKKNYRKFKISQDFNDDYSSLREMLTRRFVRYNKFCKNSKDCFSILPDLVLIDGGSAHVNVAVEVLRIFNIDVPVFGMAKDNRHQTKALVGISGNFEIKDKSEIYNFIAKIQTEVHRFAINYHKKLRGKRMMNLQTNSKKL